MEDRRSAAQGAFPLGLSLLPFGMLGIRRPAGGSETPATGGGASAAPLPTLDQLAASNPEMFAERPFFTSPEAPGALVRSNQTGDAGHGARTLIEGVGLAKSDDAAAPILDGLRRDLESTYFGAGAQPADPSIFEPYRQYYPQLDDRQWSEMKSVLFNGGLTPQSYVYRGQPAITVTVGADGAILATGTPSPIGRVIDVMSPPAETALAEGSALPLFTGGGAYTNRPARDLAPDGGLYAATAQSIADRYGRDDKVTLAISVDDILRAGTVLQPDATYAAHTTEGSAVFLSSGPAGGAVTLPATLVGGPGADALRARADAARAAYLRQLFSPEGPPPDMTFTLAPNPGLAFVESPRWSLSEPGRIDGGDINVGAATFGEAAPAPRFLLPPPAARP